MIYVVLKEGYDNPSKIIYSGTSAKAALLAASNAAAVYVKIWDKGSPLTKPPAAKAGPV
jgi:hypothetical protein